MKKPKFTYCDLFAGIGGIRQGMDAIGGKCVLTCELDKFARQTYAHNYKDGDDHPFPPDVCSLTLSDDADGLKQSTIDRHIHRQVPDIDVLLAGFPCQPFSSAGVSKRNSLNKEHGFKCPTSGTLFFDVAEIMRVKRPAVAVLENVKNLKRHDKGNTFLVIKQKLKEIGYVLVDGDHTGTETTDPMLISSKHWLPQNRVRTVMLCIREDVYKKQKLSPDKLSLKQIEQFYPMERKNFPDILEDDNDPNLREYLQGHTLGARTWEFLNEHKAKHEAAGNGFGYGLIDRNAPDYPTMTGRTLSARYAKDGSEILISQTEPMPPRKMTVLECKRYMGFPETFDFPVSYTQATRQLGNSVAVPVFNAVAKLAEPIIKKYKKGK